MLTKRIAVLTLGAAMAISLIGCGTTSSNSLSEDNSVSGESDNAKANNEELRISWWGSYERHNITIEALDLFSEQENIPLAYEYCSWSDYFDTLSSEVVGNNMPDIFQMSITDIRSYAAKGTLLDLTPYIENETIDTTYADESAISSLYIGDSIYGYPSGITSVSVAYDPKFFNAAGVSYPKDDWTWDDYVSTAKKIYSRTGVPSDIPFLIEARWLFESWVRSYGYSFFSKDGTSLPWAEDEELLAEMTECLYDIQDGIEAGYFIAPEEGVNWVDVNDNLITSGDIAITFILTNQYALYSEYSGETLGIVSLPRLEGGTDNSMYASTNLYWCISSSCKDPENAAKVINFLVNSEDASDILGTDRGISINTQIRDHLIEESDDVNTVNTIHYINHVQDIVDGVICYDPLRSTEVVAILKKNYIALAFNEMTPEECISDFIERATIILSKQ